MNPALRQSITDELIGYRRELGYVPAAVVADLAEVCGRSPRTLWRWAEQGEPAAGVRGGASGEEPAGLSERQLETVIAFSGNVTAAWRDLRAAGQAVPSRRTFHRRWQATEPTVRAYATDGADGLKAHQLYTRWQAEERNHTWNIDHEELPVWVVPTGSRTPVKPWLTSVLDDCTRTAMGVVVTFGRPGAEQAVAALAESMRLKPTSRGDQWLGGVPAGVRFDHAAEFKGRLWRQALARLGIAPRPTYPYLSHLNGKVERFQRTTQDEFCAHLPGYTGGPRTLSRRDLFGADAPELLTEPLLTELVLDWVDRYNTERGHDALAGRAPLQAWCEQHTPLRQLSDEQLRLSMLISEHAHKVTKNGVRLDKVDYTAPELADKVGGEVEARFLPHDRSFIEVFQGGQWVCSAWPHADLTPRGGRQAAPAQARAVHAGAVAARRRGRAASAARRRRQPRAAGAGPGVGGRRPRRPRRRRRRAARPRR